MSPDDLKSNLKDVAEALDEMFQRLGQLPDIVTMQSPPGDRDD